MPKRSKPTRRSTSSIKVDATARMQAVKVARASRSQMTGMAVLDVMEAYRKKITATPENSAAFLMQLGVLDAKGNQLTLCN